MLWSNQTQSARMAIVYITAGTLIDVWTAVYYFLILRPESARNPNGGSDSSLFWVAGFFLTGLALLIIGPRFWGCVHLVQLPSSRRDMNVSLLP